MPLRATAARQSRAELLERLRQRSGEIEEVAMARVISLAELPDRGGAEYAQGLRAAVQAAVAYALEGMAQGEHEGIPVPEALLDQARRAARSGVGLDTVLRRYVAGHGLLSDFLVQEAEGRVGPAELQRLLRRLAFTLDCLLAAVTAAYGIEERRHRSTTRERRTELVERLLAGEPLDVSELGYELEGWHLGLVVRGPVAEEALRALVAGLDRQVLLVSSEPSACWAWVGGRLNFSAEEIEPLCHLPADGVQRLAVGEPGEGPAGWRLTHQQALAALSVAVRTDRPVTRYRDAALLACVLQDSLLATSLRRLYLQPLEAERDGGIVLRETLHAYFAAQGNLSSAAAALGVSRKTVGSRLRTVEQHLGTPVEECAASLGLALKMDYLLTGPQGPGREGSATTMILD